MSKPKMVSVPEHQICCCYMAGAKTLPQGCAAQQNEKALESRLARAEEALDVLLKRLEKASDDAPWLTLMGAAVVTKWIIDAKDTLKEPLAGDGREP